MMPWKLEFCDNSMGDCAGSGVGFAITIKSLPTAPEPGRIPPGADHVHIVPKYSGERDAREEEKWRALTKTAARCVHGRIMGERCHACPGNRAPDREGEWVGTTRDGKAVRVPAYDHLDDIKAWISD